MQLLMLIVACLTTHVLCSWHTCDVTMSAPCEDLLANCSALAAKGACFADPALMDANCRKSCNRCASTLPTACDENATCCKHPFSNSHLGCCPLGSKAVCCNGYTCCPEGTVCQDSGEGYLVETKCVNPTTNKTEADGLQICKPGPALPMATDQKNCLVVGDSVSIGYTPRLAELLNHTAGGCLAQHSPFAGDGGAEETAYGLQCLKYFLHSSAGEEIIPNIDLLYFNWGFHNMVPDGEPVTPGQSGTLGDYLPKLRQIVEHLVRLREQHGVRLLFGLTSPFWCNRTKDDDVFKLNQQAAQLMAENSIPTVNMHAPVISACGQPPQASCLGPGLDVDGCPHYTARGYSWIAERVLAPAFKAVMAAREACSVTLYDAWSDEVNRETGAIEEHYGLGSFPLSELAGRVSSVKISGEGCRVYGFTSADCTGQPSGDYIDWRLKLDNAPAGVVTPGTNLAARWGCDNCVRCIRVEHSRRVEEITV